jgi:nucleotide-binding universal stress UspA family protein
LGHIIKRTCLKASGSSIGNIIEGEGIMYERILIPLDGSKVGETAIKNIENLALKLLPETEVDVTLLQVISELTYDFIDQNDAAQLPYDEDELKSIKLNAQKYLDKVAGELRGKGIKVNSLVTVGHVAEEIIKVAHTINADLIAMSTHGRSGLGRWALGSITDKVLHESDIPVLTVRSSQVVRKA